MAKNLKLHIKNTQLAEAINLSGLKARLSRKKDQSPEEEAAKVVQEHEGVFIPVEEEAVVEQRVVEERLPEEAVSIQANETPQVVETVREIPAVVETPVVAISPPVVDEPHPEPVSVEITPVVEVSPTIPEKSVSEPFRKEAFVPPPPQPPRPFLSASRNNPEQLGPVFGREPSVVRNVRRPPFQPPREAERSLRPAYEPLRDRRPPPPKAPIPPEAGNREPFPRQAPGSDRSAVVSAERPRPRREESSAPRVGFPPKEGAAEGRPVRRFEGADAAKKGRPKGPEIKPRGLDVKGFVKRSDGHGVDSRLRRGIAGEDDEGSGWRKRRPIKGYRSHEQQPEVLRPSKVSVRIPITVKDLAVEMKLKASQLISSLFMHGTVVTLNDVLSDEVTIQLLGHEVGCEVIIDTSEEQRLRITDKTISEEIHGEEVAGLVLRPPVVTFMGHVDHGKTSLIDAIRKTHRADGEVGAITQHIVAFMCTTDLGPIAIIDTPGHEAFSAMRERGAELTDIVVLVVAGDEGIKEQTVEALNQAKESKATIIVAINKSDKPNFDPERVYRQLTDHELLPEAWGGKTVTVNCSAVTHEGIKDLLEMIALQSEVLELKANPHARARGTVIESEMRKGIGVVATVLVQNGTLHSGDCLVFGSTWARVKAMRDDLGVEMLKAGPSTPVRINGLSGLPDAGEEFIVVKNEKEARDIADSRHEGLRQLAFQTNRRGSLENMMEKASGGVPRKVFNVILRADVQGSLEALKTALMKIESKKVDLNIISLAVGEITESDVQLATASNATILGFHTSIEAHAEPMVKGLGVSVRLHDIIYHAQDDVRVLMRKTLDKIAEEQERGKAEIRAIFKSSQLGLIAGCTVLEGSLTRNCSVRVRRGKDVLWSGPVDSLKRFKDDVKEVTKGTECGIVLRGFSAYQEGDVLEAFEIVYHEQEL